ncbi:aromatic acid exporter family protein [Paenibacillus gansuensis]|uniref:Aromatic acid exporter family protein n=1 Tax=Paenibacillus gansuensis TaxID=306542 RepID=A0ABW5P9Z5_9BACL
MGIRVIKTAAAALIAIYLAQWIGLQTPLSAGLLAILGVEVTRKKGLQMSLIRFAASVFGLLLASLIFQLLGFHIYALSLYILVVFPILGRTNLKDGIVTCSVMVFHVFTAGEVSGPVVWNEVLLLLVGLGTATIFNLSYMPKEDMKLNAIRDETEDLFSAIFLHVARSLRDTDYIWGGQEVLDAAGAVEQGLSVAKRIEENRLLKSDHSPVMYFLMRRQQLECIDRMLGLVAQVYRVLPHSELTAELFEELSIDVRAESYTGNVEASLSGLERQFKAMALPVNREEFEVRSALLQLCLELRYYLSIAKQKQPKKTVYR